MRITINGTILPDSFSNNQMGNILEVGNNVGRDGIITLILPSISKFLCNLVAIGVKVKTSSF
jgi:hypothetical protein